MNESRGTRYQRFRRRARAAGLAAAATALGLVAFTPAGPGLAAWASAVAAGAPGVWREPAAFALFVLAVALVLEFAALPARLYTGVEGAARRGASGIGLRAALTCEARLAVVAVAGLLAAATVVQTAILRLGAWWWFGSGLVLAVGLLAALHAAPVIVAAAARARPVRRPALAERLSGLALRAGVPVASVDEIPVHDADDTTAFVAGLGGFRKVFLASTVVRDWSDDEIAVVIAHELGHHRHRDLWATAALDAALLTSGLVASHAALPAIGPAAGGLGTLAALPVIGWVAGAVWVGGTPLRHALSRRQERRADRFALDLTGAAGAFAAVIRRLAARHLADERPALAWQLTSRHPTVAERLAIADAHQTAAGPVRSGRRQSMV